MILMTRCERAVFRALVLAILAGPLLATAIYYVAGQARAQNQPGMTTPHLVLARTGCGANVVSQIPGRVDLFLGRQMIVAPGADPCRGTRTGIVLDRLDWTRHAFTLIRWALTTPVTIGRGAAEITNAYDPYVASYDNELWVAFECVGRGIQGTSTCMGPFDLERAAIDPARTYVAIEGRQVGPHTAYSASDPKLLVYRNRIYLYWTAIRSEDKKWVSVATRGAELIRERGLLRRFWPAGANRATSSFDPRTNEEVWAGADMGSVMAINNVIYATGSDTRGDCVKPTIDVPNCFRVIMARSTSPLRYDVFNRSMAKQDMLPSNPTEYPRFAVDPKGQLFVIGHVLPVHSSQRGGIVLPDGLIAYPVNLARLFAR
jgi:hypothetical protein